MIQSSQPNESRIPTGSSAKRLKVIVAYDGRPFRGWQSQVGGNTIQDHVEAAFFKVLQWKIRVHGAGRTDAGVHALGQCAHVDVPANSLAPTVLMNALNASLPEEIRILRCTRAPENFHARFSAQGKTYRYRIVIAPVLSPFELGRVWHVVGPLDRTVLDKCAQLFLGEHDFSAFAANRGRPTDSAVRTLSAIRVRHQRRLIEIDLRGDGFLYKMVRMIVASMIQCAQAKVSLTEVRHRLDRRVSPKNRPVAPATGLFLLRVHY